MESTTVTGLETGPACVRRFTYVGLPHLTTQSFVIAVITHIVCVGMPIALASYKKNGDRR